MNRTKAPIATWDRYDLPNCTIGSTRHWILAVRPIQITLGSCVLLMKRPVHSIPAISGAQMADLLRMIQRFEHLLNRSFQPDSFNYVFSMQHEPAVHMHAIPRYAATRTFGEKYWVDSDWPHFLDFPRVDSTPVWLRHDLAAFLRKKNSLARSF